MVVTEIEFDNALRDARGSPAQPHLIHAKLIEGDGSVTLKNLAERKGKHVG